MVRGWDLARSYFTLRDDGDDRSCRHLWMGCLCIHHHTHSKHREQLLERRRKKKNVWMDRTGNHAWPPTVANHHNVRSADQYDLLAPQRLHSGYRSWFMLWENISKYHWHACRGFVFVAFGCLSQQFTRAQHRATSLYDIYRQESRFSILFRSSRPSYQRNSSTIQQHAWLGTRKYFNRVRIESYVRRILPIDAISYL